MIKSIISGMIIGKPLIMFSSNSLALGFECDTSRAEDDDDTMTIHCTINAGSIIQWLLMLQKAGSRGQRCIRNT